MRNPYSFVNKANSTFNLYLEKFSEFEKFMKDSKMEQEKINRLISELKEEHINYQKEVNSSLRKLSNTIHEELSENKKLIQEYNSEFDNLNEMHQFNYEKINNSINKFDRNFNKSVIQNEISIEDSNSEIINNLNTMDSSLRGHVDDVVGGLDSSLRGHVDDVVGGLDSSLRGHVDDVVGGLDSSFKFINNQNDDLKELSANLINTINDFEKNQNFYNNKVNKAVNLFNSLYSDCKNYYLNNQVEELNKYLRTGELFKLGFFNDIKFISYSPAENKILLQSSEGIFFLSNNRFYTIKEVIGFNGYSIPQLYSFDDFVVFDVGMNRGYASLWFANFEKCSHVYGFEIDDSTYDKAVENILLNKHLSNKITPFNIGFSDKDEIVDLYYLSGCDGVNTIISEFTDIQTELKQNKEEICTKQVEVKKASEVISNIIKKDNITSKIVLKIDTEGAEYNIINDLINSNIIGKLDVILGEGHIFSDNDMVNDLSNYGFKQIKFKIDEFTYEFAFVKEKYCNIWELKK